MAGGLDYYSNDAEVFSLVEARFQGRTVRSSASPGSTPQWNQVLSLPFVPPAGQDLSPAKLADIQETLHLALFDEVCGSPLPHVEPAP
jgi:hypothetical protein